MKSSAFRVIVHREIRRIRTEFERKTVAEVTGWKGIAAIDGARLG
jgi:hypothetical protein